MSDSASRIITAVLGLALIACPLLLGLGSKGTAGEARPAAPKPNAAPAASNKAKGEESPRPPAAEPPEPADNSYCLVCHANYERENLTAVHQPADVGCEKCHGASIKHSGDEDGLTPPDKMYAKAQVNSFCISCHEKPKLMKRDEHKEFFKEMTPGDTCSDCHAEKHRLRVRTRVWDKKTGRLIKDDGVRMMLKNSPATEGAAQKAQ